MDVHTNLPVKIDVFECKDLTTVKDETGIAFTLKYSYPDSFSDHMIDLSPSSYDTFLQHLLVNEQFALDFNAKTTMEHSEALTVCDEKCRLKIFCSFNYAVNEQTLLCRGTYVDFEFGSKYMIGLFQNPWYKI